MRREQPPRARRSAPTRAHAGAGAERARACAHPCAHARTLQRCGCECRWPSRAASGLRVRDEERPARVNTEHGSRGRSGPWLMWISIYGTHAADAQYTNTEHPIGRRRHRAGPPEASEGFQKGTADVASSLAHIRRCAWQASQHSAALAVLNDMPHVSALPSKPACGSKTHASGSAAPDDAWRSARAVDAFAAPVSSRACTRASRCKAVRGATNSRPIRPHTQLRNARGSMGNGSPPY
jgi:hypothetical protein